jgi:hypothetical protein
MENDANLEFQSEPIHSSRREQVEAYLRETYSWHLTPEKIDRDFRAVLEKPFGAQASCSEVEFLASLDRLYFVEVLTSRGVLTQDEIQAIADQLESIRLEVLLAMETHQQQVATTTFRQTVEHYLIQAPKDQLLSDTSLPEFQILMQDGNPSFEHLNQRLAPYSREELRQILVQRLTHRQDITYEEIGQILDALEATRDRVLAAARRGEQPQVLALQDGTNPGEPAPKEPEPQEPEHDQPKGLEPDAQSPTPNRAGAYTWSTWEQAKWQPSATTAQTAGTALSWSTWGEINQKVPHQAADVQPQSQPSPPSETVLTWSSWEQLRSDSTSSSESAATASSEDDLPSEAPSTPDSDDISTQNQNS